MIATPYPSTVARSPAGAANRPARWCISARGVIARSAPENDAPNPAPPVPRIREQRNQPRPKIVSNKHHASSLPARQPIRRFLAAFYRNVECSASSTAADAPAVTRRGPRDALRKLAPEPTGSVQAPSLVIYWRCRSLPANNTIFDAGG